jgi:hypothetical protein
MFHPGARHTNGLVQKMGRFPWQEFDEVGDLGRFPEEASTKWSEFDRPGQIQPAHDTTSTAHSHLSL